MITKETINTLGIAAISSTAIEGSEKVAQVLTEVAAAPPDFTGILQIIIQIAIGIGTLLKLFKKEKKNDVDGQ
jgi:hypothetical protein